jgi:8-oxo-dGTP pyrophosphatase MutT (NUDIX family)
VFDHPLDEGGVMVQLPAGTIDRGEEPAVAVVRELWEETGVEASHPALAGVCDEDWQGEARRRWVFVFEAPDGLADEWPYHCDCGAETRCHWLSLHTATIYEPQQPWLDLARAHIDVHAPR